MFFDNYCTKAKKLSEKKVPNFKPCTGRKNLRLKEKGKKEETTEENMEAFKSSDSS
jgi:hypothetical protein